MLGENVSASFEVRKYEGNQGRIQFPSYLSA